MSDLLIHSMKEFGHLILPALAYANVRHIVEIGAEHGGMSQLLARYCERYDGHLTSIDPAPSAQFRDWVATASHVRHVELPSLQAIGQTSDVDAWMVDGDHNWYTVYNELHGIREQSRRDQRPMLVFLHDVGWPCARRDQYYAPERIPAQFRHPHSFDHGVLPDRTDAIAGRGWRGNGHFALALNEGGPHNGVLTAVEDFVTDCHGHDESLAWASIPGVFGLGVLFDLNAPWSTDIAALLAPHHENPLLQRLEENRLQNFLAVVEWQDSQSVCA